MISKRLSVLALTAICVASLGETPRDATWTMARANAELNPVVESLVPDLSWRTPLTDGTNATPVVANGRVFIDGNGHVLWTLDLYTGSVLWQQLAGNELSGVPLLYNGVVIISQGQPSGRGANGIVGIDATTGKRLWYASLDGSGTPTPAIVDGQLVNHDSTGELEVFDPTTGTERWHKNLGTHAHASAITPISPTAFVTAGDDPDDVVAMDVRSRKILWRAPLPADARSAGSTYLAYDGTRIFGMYFAPRAATEKAPYHATQRLYALDAKTGHTLWSADVASGVAQERFLSSIPLVHDDTVYAGSPLAPTFSAFDTVTGKPRWSVTLGAPAARGSVLKDNVIYVPTTSGTVYALAANDGHVIGQHTFPDVFVDTSPSIAGDSLVIGGDHGYVFAMPLAAIRASNADTP